MSKAIRKYVQTYAEPECAALEGMPPIDVRYFLVVPSCRETAAFAQRIAAGPLSKLNLLAIVVINQPPGAEELLNRQLMTHFQQLACIWQNRNLHLFTNHSGSLHWLVVDRFSAGLEIDPKHGVGLARKLGCDLAVALLVKRGKGEGWIGTTDADAALPDDYFDALEQCSGDASAAVFSANHQLPTKADPRILSATLQYERALRYYTDGLAWAGSPYAFPTIGSALAVKAKAYCECRGFPRRAGGEDFYLLNKLAKIGRVIWLKRHTIQIEARISDRVPFGTGPAVAKILSLADPSEFLYYDPRTFVDLHHWLQHIPMIWSRLQADENPLQALPEGIQQALTEAGIEALWAHIRRQIATATDCERAIHHWFDGFQTLKFIRRLQAICYPALPLAQCLQNAPFYQDRDLCWN